MPAPTPPLYISAEAVAGLLEAMDVTLAVDLTGERLLAEIARDADSGALDVLRIATERFRTDGRFREDMTNVVASFGYLLSDAPGLDADIETMPAWKVVQILRRAGLVLGIVETNGDDPAGSVLTFRPMPASRPTPNAHLLMDVANRRFASDADFSETVRRMLTHFSAGG